MKAISQYFWVFFVLTILLTAVSANIRPVGFTDVTYAKTTTTTLRSAPTAMLVDHTLTTTGEAPDCDGMAYPSKEKCVVGKCPLEGYECEYVGGATSKGYCKCIKHITVTTTTQPVRYSNACEDIDDAGERTCAAGKCAANQACKYVRQASAANVGSCKCVDVARTTTTTQGATFTLRPYTTSTLQYRWCEDLTDPSERMCMQGLCPPNTVCRVRSDVVRPSAGTLTQASSGNSGGGDFAVDSFFDVYTEIEIDVEGPGCVCVPCRYRPPTTTLPKKCQTIGDASDRQCRAGLCPPNMRCVYKPNAQSGFLAAAPAGGTCECIGGTTTTLPPRCEAMTDAGVSQCMHGLCPPEYRCRYAPDLTRADAGSCLCVQPTTTTLPGQDRCDQLTSTGEAECRPGLCPPEHMCRYIPSLASADMGGCRCIPPTTTTVQGQVRCEAVDDAGAATCKRAICPPEQKCRYLEDEAGKGSCLCVSPPTTTTLPANTKCERIADASSVTCEQGLCPVDHKCEVITYNFGSTSVSNCVCIPKAATTTTTIPGDIKCEAIDYSAQKTCKEGLCPPNTRCEVVKYNFGSTSVANCVCMEGPTTTTIEQTERKCEGIDYANEKSCMEGLCPMDEACIVKTDDSGAKRCTCMPKNKKPVKKADDGFLSSLWNSVFG